MKRGFTLIELIFVIIIIGILSAVLVPKFTRPTLIEAANQIVSHIQYTQHLAMVDNKFDPNDQYWYRKRWQILFGKSSAGAQNTDDEWAYTIFSDTSGTGNPDIGEIAVNPGSSSTLLSGGFSGTLDWEDARAIRSMNIGKKYNIDTVTFSNCGGVGRRMAFDNIGRPIRGNISTMTQPYQLGRILKTKCKITLHNRDGESIDIIIEPETGYTHRL
jgi:prepilin-type N-terminal cleavage/methylation domain-containing protein